MVEQGRKPKDFVHPGELTELERRTLKFSFSVIERMRELIRDAIP
jgi:signal-transduction protein with cAMP-binding, CBS, and nucleotidyltransferase domain